jgi:hypothetical protein
VSKRTTLPLIALSMVTLSAAGCFGPPYEVYHENAKGVVKTLNVATCESVRDHQGHGDEVSFGASFECGLDISALP